MTESSDIQEEQTGVDEETQKEVPPPEVVVPIAERLSSFFEYLPTAVERSDLEEHLLITPYGLFVVESWLTDVVRHYCTFYQKESSGKSISVEKAIQKLFHTDMPGLTYVMKGKQVQPGYLLEEKLVAPQRFSIPQYKGKPMDAVDYIHPRDPLFIASTFTSALGPEGFTISCTLNGEHYSLSEATLRELAASLRQSREFVQEYPAVKSSLRAVVQNLPALFQHAQAFPRRRRVLIPQSIASANCSFVKLNNSLCLAISKGEESKRVLALVQTGGRSRKDLLFEEFSEVFQVLRKKLKKLGIYIPKNRGPFLFHLTKNGEVYKVPAGVFLSFVDDLIYARALSRKINRFFTVADALAMFAEVFQDAVRVEPDTLHEVFRNTATPDARWFRRDGWVYQVTSARTFLSASYEPSVEQKPARYRKQLQIVQSRAKQRSSKKNPRRKGDKKPRRSRNHHNVKSEATETSTKSESPQK